MVDIFACRVKRIIHTFFLFYDSNLKLCRGLYNLKAPIKVPFTYRVLGHQSTSTSLFLQSL